MSGTLAAAAEHLPFLEAGLHFLPALGHGFVAVLATLWTLTLRGVWLCDLFGLPLLARGTGLPCP